MENIRSMKMYVTLMDSTLQPRLLLTSVRLLQTIWSICPITHTHRSNYSSLTQHRYYVTPSYVTHDTQKLRNFLIHFQAYCSHVGPVSYVLYLELDEHAPNPER